jgi:hypothetical protein
MVNEKWDALLKELQSSLHDVATIVSNDRPERLPYGLAQADCYPTDDDRSGLFRGVSVIAVLC